MHVPALPCRALRRPLTAVVAVVLALPLVLLGARPAAAAPSPAALEVQFTDLVNDERTRAGLPTLQVDVRLLPDARDWSAQMAAQGRLSHDPQLPGQLPPEHEWWAENAGYTHGADPAPQLHRSLMGSPQHRANILGDHFTNIGVGVVVRGDRTWATMRFTGGRPAAVDPAVAGIAGLVEGALGGGTAERVVVVRDDIFADALGAGPLAGTDGAVLLTPPGPALHPRVLAAIHRVLPAGRTVYVIGGPAALSPGIEAELGAHGWAVRRLAGVDRVETAAAAARELQDRVGPPETVLIATSGTWPDAAAGSAWGAATGSPVLLSYPDGLSRAVSAALDDIDEDRVVVLGGATALSPGITEQTGGRRISGPTREATAVAVAAELWGRRVGVDGRRFMVAPAGDEGWTWALGAAPLAAGAGTPLLLARDPFDPTLAAYLDVLRVGAAGPGSADVIGPVDPEAAQAVLDRLAEPAGVGLTGVLP